MPRRRFSILPGHFRSRWPEHTAAVMIPSQRIQSLPVYAFAAVDEAKDELAAKGVDVIDFGVGDHTLPSPAVARERLKAAVDEHASTGYPSYVGSKNYRQAIADWTQRRFGVTLGWQNALDGGDRLELSFVRPLSVIDGSGSARVPVGRTLDGQVIYDQESFSVASDAQPLDVGLTWLGARDEWAPGRPLAYGVQLGWSSDDVTRDLGDTSVLFALQAKF